MVVVVEVVAAQDKEVAASASIVVDVDAGVVVGAVVVVKVAEIIAWQYCVS